MFVGVGYYLELVFQTNRGNSFAFAKQCYSLAELLFIAKRKHKLEI
jgi:hypothetical protein